MSTFISPACSWAAQHAGAVGVADTGAYCFADTFTIICALVYTNAGTVFSAVEIADASSIGSAVVITVARANSFTHGYTEPRTFLRANTDAHPKRVGQG